MKTVHIDASRSYDVRIGRGLLDDCGRQIAERVRCANAAVVADDTVYALYGERVCASLEAAGVPYVERDSTAVITMTHCWPIVRSMPNT